VVELDEGIGGPERLMQLFPGDNLPRVSQEHSQHAKRLFLKLDLPAVFA
jgi:hypothetical protein